VTFVNPTAQNRNMPYVPKMTMKKMSISSRFHDVFEIEINERIRVTEQKDHFWLIVTSSVPKDKKDRLK